MEPSRHTVHPVDLAQAQARLRFFAARMGKQSWPLSCGYSDHGEMVACARLVLIETNVVIFCVHGAVYTFLPTGDC
jgi:hypothetical protein